MNNALNKFRNIFSKQKIKNFIKAALAVVFLVFVYKCPIRLIFSVPCPGCGLTRAFIAFFRGDFSQAFMMHPLFLLVAVELIYLLFRKRFAFSQKTELVALLVTCALFAGVYIYRFKTNTLV